MGDGEYGSHGKRYTQQEVLEGGRGAGCEVMASTGHMARDTPNRRCWKVQITYVTALHKADI
jgi:hypothetical protein